MRILRPREFTWHRHLSKTKVSIPCPKPHSPWHSKRVGWSNKLEKHSNQTVLLEARKTCLILFLPGFLRFLTPDPFPVLNPQEEEAEPSCPWAHRHWKQGTPPTAATALSSCPPRSQTPCEIRPLLHFSAGAFTWGSQAFLINPVCLTDWNDVSSQAIHLELGTKVAPKDSFFRSPLAVPRVLPSRFYCAYCPCHSLGLSMYYIWGKFLMCMSLHPSTWPFSNRVSTVLFTFKYIILITYLIHHFWLIEGKSFLLKMYSI